MSRSPHDDSDPYGINSQGHTVGRVVFNPVPLPKDPAIVHQSVKAPPARASYLLVSQMYSLNLACRPITKRYATCYLVGSVLTRPDWRDVDVRCLLDEKEFAIIHDPMLDAAVSEWLRARTGLPIDFQFQWSEQANKEFDGQRNALGIR